MIWFVGSIMLAIAAVIGVFLTLWRLPDMITARRVRAGKCGDCGYDLSASNRACPECGNDPESMSRN